MLSRLRIGVTYCMQTARPIPSLKPSLSWPKIASLHTTGQKMDLMEFVDDKANWGAAEVKSGRSWRADDLRLKSNEDLHKLWFVLLKERNMLLTMEHAAKEEKELLPSAERIDKVKESMKNLEEVVRERNRAYWLLETGEKGPEAKKDPHEMELSEVIQATVERVTEQGGRGVLYEYTKKNMSKKLKLRNVNTSNLYRIFRELLVILSTPFEIVCLSCSHPEGTKGFPLTISWTLPGPSTKRLLSTSRQRLLSRFSVRRLLKICPQVTKEKKKRSGPEGNVMKLPHLLPAKGEVLIRARAW
nr:EOG090X0DBE [Lepidurus arcticus]